MPLAVAAVVAETAGSLYAAFLQMVEETVSSYRPKHLATSDDMISRFSDLLRKVNTNLKTTEHHFFWTHNLEVLVKVTYAWWHQ